MSADLKSCPFCGQAPQPAFENLFDNDDDEIETCWTMQHTCPLLASDLWTQGATKSEAEAAWNTRATPTPDMEKVKP